jgi:hypothetical protein
VYPYTTRVLAGTFVVQLSVADVEVIPVTEIPVGVDGFAQVAQAAAESIRITNSFLIYRETFAL